MAEVLYSISGSGWLPPAARAVARGPDCRRILVLKFEFVVIHCGVSNLAVLVWLMALGLSCVDA